MTRVLHDRSHVALCEHILAILYELAPRAFFKDPKQRIPLAKDIVAQIEKKQFAELEDLDVAAAVQWYQGHYGYLKSCSQAGANRVRLSGRAAEAITPSEARAYDKQRIEAALEIQERREQQTNGDPVATMQQEYGRNGMSDDNLSKVDAPERPKRILPSQRAQPEEHADNTQDYPYHAIVADWAQMELGQQKKFEKSLREIGLVEPITIWQGQIVDGRHRNEACTRLHVVKRYNDITASHPLEADMIAFVVAKNSHRRRRVERLPPETKRALARPFFEKDPTQSNAQIAKLSGLPESEVGKIRHENPAWRLQGRGHSRKWSNEEVEDRKSKIPFLNSLAWRSATSSERSKFVATVGLQTIFEAAPESSQTAFLDWLNYRDE